MLIFLTKSLMFLHMFVGVILIGIILLQRGRGGGLAGAFGGMGGQSAFGNRAGDLFTRITIGIATVWIVLGCVCVIMASNYKRGKTNLFQEGTAAGVKVAPANDDAADKKDDATDKKDSSALPPGPGNPPAGSSTESKTDGESKDQQKSDVKPAAEGDQPAKPAEKNEAAPEAKEETEKPKEASDSGTTEK